MISQEDIADVILDVLGDQRTGEEEIRKILEREPAREGKWGFHVRRPENWPARPPAYKRFFVSEYDLKRILKDGRKKLRLPKSAIVSPLAQEWLAEKGVEIIVE